ECADDQVFCVCIQSGVELKLHRERIHFSSGLKRQTSISKLLRRRNSGAASEFCVLQNKLIALCQVCNCCCVLQARRTATRRHELPNAFPQKLLLRKV